MCVSNAILVTSGIRVTNVNNANSVNNVMERVRTINAVRKIVMVVKMPAVHEEDATETDIEIEIRNGAKGKLHFSCQHAC